MNQLNATSGFIVIGACHTDRLQYLHGPVQTRASNPVTSHESPGGVAHNIASNLAFLKQDCTLISMMGDDHMADALKTHLGLVPLKQKIILTNPKIKTASYTGVLDEEGELYIGLADMDIYEDFTVDKISPHLKDMKHNPNWIIDANLPKKTIDYLCHNAHDICVYAAPVSPSKALKFKPLLGRINVLIANKLEAEILSDLAISTLDQAKEACRTLRQSGPDIVIITMGPQGAVMAYDNHILHLPPLPTDITNVNGCGDAFFAGCAAGLANGLSKEHALAQGLSLAHFTTQVKGTITKQASLQAINAQTLQLLSNISKAH